MPFRVTFFAAHAIICIIMVYLEKEDQILEFLHLNATFGRLEQHELHLHSGLNLICAPNESGKSTWGSFICAMLYGPVDACIVGLLGAFLEQMLKYGFTATTLLWILPAAIRGLIVGLGVVLFRKQMSTDAIASSKKPFVYYAVCIVAGLVTSCANTLVYYLDSVINYYYSYALIFGVFWTRLATGALSSFLTATVALPVVLALRKFHLTDTRKRVSVQ